MDLLVATDDNASIGGQRRFRLAFDCVRFGFAAAMLDIFASLASSIAAHALGLLRTGMPGESHPLGSAMGIGLVAAFFYLLMMKSAGLYGLPAFLDGKKLLLRVLRYGLLSDVLLIVVLFLAESGPDAPRGLFLFLLPLQQIMLVASRVVSTRLAKTLIARGDLAGPRALLVGDEAELAQITRADLFSEFGLTEVGRVAVAPASGAGFDAAVTTALATSRMLAVERLAVAVSWHDEARLEGIRTGLRLSALPALLLPDATVRRVSGRCMGLPQRSALRAITLQRAPMPAATLALKRGLDIALAAGAIVALAPIMVAAAAAIRLESDGPVIFRQRRLGFDRRPFTILKFRSMFVLEDGAHIRQAVKGDRRVTRVGAFLRRSSLDELPQLFNVVLGHMSLVGPRPHAFAHDNIYADLVERYSLRHRVKPGITGWAQINGARGQTQEVGQMQRRVELDLWYIDHCSIWLDLFILARTCFAIFKDDAF